MKLASYKVRGRESFGAVVGDGVVDLKLRLGAGYDDLLDLLRAGALVKAREAVRGARADFALSEVTLLAPVTAPEKILCIGINYANRNADYGDQDIPKYPSMFYRAPNSLAAHMQPLVLPHESIELDYEGEIALVIGKGGRRIAASDALDHVAGVTLVQRGHHPRLDPPRQVQRHAGQELGFDRRHRPLDRDVRRDRPDAAPAPDRQAQRRSDAGRHHRQSDQDLPRADRLCQHVHDAEGAATSSSPARR